VDPEHPLAETLAALRRETTLQRLLLRELSEDDVSALLSALDDDAAGKVTGSRTLASAIHRETEGNPFFVRELLSNLVEEGKLYREAGRWKSSVADLSALGVPEGIREVIGRRLARLSEGCNRLLTVGSAMPGGFSWTTIKALTDEDEAALLDSLDEALAAQLVAERKSDGPDAGTIGETYDFTHALIRHTLYDGINTPRRIMMHRQIAEALETLYAANIEPRLPELAYHFIKAAPGGDVDKAVNYATHAA
jgi:predicted ATPase